MRLFTFSSSRAAWVAALALMAMPIVDIGDHAELHAGETGFVHAEAAHPKAAPHLEVEEHFGADACRACLQSSGATEATVLVQAIAADLESDCGDLGRTPARRPCLGSADPRGPPV